MPKLSLLQLSRSKYFVPTCLIGGFLGIVLFIFLVCGPLLAKIDHQRSALNELKINIASAQALTNMLPGQEAEFREVQELYNNFKERMGTEASMAHILETLNVSAQKRQLEIVAIQPRTNGEQPLIEFGSILIARQKPVHIQLSGRFRSVAEFLGMLPNVPFFASVKELKLATSESGGLRIQTDLLLAVYLGEDKEPL